MKEWGILGREGSCTAIARCKGCDCRVTSAGTDVSYIIIHFVRVCVCPTRQFRVLIRRQNRFWILGLGFFSRGSKGGNKGPRENDRAHLVGVCILSLGAACNSQEGVMCPYYIYEFFHSVEFWDFNEVSGILLININ
jgi:hypothetical protein